MDLNCCETFNGGRVALNKNIYTMCLHYGHEHCTYTYEYYAPGPDETFLRIEIQTLYLKFYNIIFCPFQNALINEMFNEILVEYLELLF